MKMIVGLIGMSIVIAMIVCTFGLIMLIPGFDDVVESLLKKCND